MLVVVPAVVVKDLSLLGFSYIVSVVGFLCVGSVLIFADDLVVGLVCIVVVVLVVDVVLGKVVGVMYCGWFVSGVLCSGVLVA